MELKYHYSGQTENLPGIVPKRGKMFAIFPQTVPTGKNPDFLFKNPDFGKEPAVTEQGYGGKGVLSTNKQKGSQ